MRQERRKKDPRQTTGETKKPRHGKAVQSGAKSKASRPIEAENRPSLRESAMAEYLRHLMLRNENFFTELEQRMDRLWDDLSRSMDELTEIQCSVIDERERNRL